MSEKNPQYDNVAFWLEFASADPHLGDAMFLAFENRIGKEIAEKVPPEKKEEFYKKLEDAKTAESLLKLCGELGIDGRASIAEITNDAKRIYFDWRRN